MDKQTPIKRSIELQPLSRDHHFGLLLCWKIRTGIELKIEPQRIADYVVFFYNSHLASHFKEEELHVFTLVAGNDAVVRRALDEHRQIKRLVGFLERKVSDYSFLTQIEEILNNHIRFEERELFPYIELIADKSGLKKTGEIIADLHNGVTEPVWVDEFWVKK